MTKNNNEIASLLDELCKYKIMPRYGEPINDGFTISLAHTLLARKNIHYSKKTVERRLNALVKAGILQKGIAGKEMAYWRGSAK